MTAFLQSPLSGWLAIALMGLGGFGAIYMALAMPSSPVKDKWDQYVRFLDKYVKFLLLKKSGTEIARTQALALAACALAFTATGHPALLIALMGIAFIPWAWLESEQGKRIEQLEAQLDGWLLMLSNALKATPAIGEAIKSTVQLVQAPMSEELDLLVKENQLGTPVDKAVLNAAERMQSQTIAGALATIVIARQTGGDLSAVLESSAGTLREMSRLEGVVKTKTAEGKGQTVVLGAMPFVMSGVLSLIDPEWLKPLASGFIGYTITGIALTMWFISIVWARKILAVDI